MNLLYRSDVPGYPRREGKVRDVYDLGDRLVIIASDRISAFDWVMPTPIPGKGQLLTALSKFWFQWLNVPNHWISDDVTTLPPAFHAFAGRTMIVRKTVVVPFECVARGYLAGSGWAEYQRSGTVCGIPLPTGLQKCERLPAPIFTPATKPESGHDENVSFDVLTAQVGVKRADELRDRTLEIYRRAAAYAESRGLILADTKFEWGTLPSGELILNDEVLTPDSSRFWPASTYRPGTSPPSFDKQFLRDWLETTTWDKASPPPNLPPEIVAQTAAKYADALAKLTGPAVN